MTQIEKRTEPAELSASQTKFLVQTQNGTHTQCGFVAELYGVFSWPFSSSASSAQSRLTFKKMVIPANGKTTQLSFLRYSFSAGDRSLVTFSSSETVFLTSSSYTISLSSVMFGVVFESFDGKIGRGFCSSSNSGLLYTTSLF